jgi:hypothetical protein
MGLMDFLKKRSDAGIGAEESGLNTNFDNSFSTDNNINTPQTSFGSGFQPEQQLNPSMSLSTMNNNTFGQSPMSQMSQPQGLDISKDLQMISLKLDAIKSDLDAMNQRLKSLESIAEREQLKTNKKWY